MVHPKLMAKRVAASAVKSNQQTVVFAAEIVLVNADVEADEDMEGVMGDATEVVAGAIEIAEECLTSTPLIYPTPLAHRLYQSRYILCW